MSSIFASLFDLLRAAGCGRAMGTSILANAGEECRAGASGVAAARPPKLAGFPSGILSSFLREFRAGDGGRAVGASLPGIRNAECGIPNAEWGNGADGMARRKDETTTGQKVEPRSPSEQGARPAVLRSCRPVVGGPEPGAGFPGERPVDAIDRIDAIDEVGRARRPSDQAATPDFVEFVDCVDCVEGSVKRRSGAGGEELREALQPLAEERVGEAVFLFKEVDHVLADEFVNGLLDRRRVARVGQLQERGGEDFAAAPLVICPIGIMPFGSTARFLQIRGRKSTGFSVLRFPLFPSGILFFFQKSPVKRVCLEENQTYTRLTAEFQAPDAAARRPAKPDPLAATYQLPFSA